MKTRTLTIYKGPSPFIAGVLQGEGAYGLDLSGGIYTNGAILIPNNLAIAQKDSGGTARSLIGMGSSDATVLGPSIGNIFVSVGGGGAFAPIDDNSFAIGGSGNRWASVHTMAGKFYGSSSGVILLVAPAAAGTNTITFPAATGTVALSAGASIPTLATGDILYASAANTLAALADVATGNALISGGVGVAPSWGKIGLTTHVSGTLGGGNGGTGIASYTTGDILQAATGSTFAALAAVATGNALISGGVGAQGSWGKIGLTTHVSGTLAAGNGGTGITSLGTGVATALGIAVGSAGGPVTFNGAGGTPSSLTLTNATALPVAGITASTSTALGIGSLELGHATDTTITRVSAGVIAVEGVNVILNGGAGGTPSSLTLTNAIGLPLGSITGLGAGVATLLAGASSGTGGPAGTISPSFTTPVLGAATGSTLALGGALLNGLLSLQATGTSAGMTVKQTDGASSTTGGATIDVQSDLVELIAFANGTARTTSRYGLTIGGYGELTLFAGTNGLVVGSTSNAPLLLGTNNAIRATFSTAGALRLHNYGAGFLVTDSSGNITASTLGTNVATALGIAVGSAGGPVTFNGAGGTPSSLILTNATALPVAGITASTSTALGVGSVELGHASDTTLSRSSAGVIAVEGVTVPLNSITNIHTAQQIELGHASDTTISRASAGVIAVEGVNVILNGGAGGTPSSLTGTNITGVPLTTGVTGLLPIANGGNATAVSFSGYLSSDQTPSADTWTKVQINTENSDPSSWFDNATNYRFQPDIAGVYLVVGQLNMDVGLSYGGVAIYKNGAAWNKYILKFAAADTLQMSVPAIVTMNGSTDYVELWGYASGATHKFYNGSRATSLEVYRLA